MARKPNGKSQLSSQAAPMDTAQDRDLDSTQPSGVDPATPTNQEIAEAAYQRYLSRGADHGRDFDDWLEAERELRSRR